jgi:hypothetical protein
MEETVLSWISDTIFRAISWIPNWLYADDTPRYLIVRGVLGLLLMVVIILAIAVWSNRGLRQTGRDQSLEKGSHGCCVVFVLIA